MPDEGLAQEWTPQQIKLWRHDRTERPFQWSARQWLVFVLERRPLAANKYFKRELEPLLTFLRQLIGDSELRAPKGTAQRGEPVPDDAQDDWAASTQALVAMMVYSMGQKFHEKNRRRARGYFKGFLQRFLRVEQVREFFCAMPDDFLDLCNVGGEGQQACVHVFTARVDWPTAACEDPWGVLMEAFKVIVDKTDCMAMQAWLIAACHKLAKLIDDAAEDMDFEQNPLKSKAVRSGRKRCGRIDPDFKAAAVEAAKKARCASVKAFLKHREDDRGAGADGWLVQELLEFWATCHMTWRDGGTVFIVPDAQRVSSEDTVITSLWHGNSETAGWLPVSVLRGNELRFGLARNVLAIAGSLLPRNGDIRSGFGFWVKLCQIRSS